MSAIDGVFTRDDQKLILNFEPGTYTVKVFENDEPPTKWLIDNRDVQ